MTPDVVVVGGGAIGTAVALELARRGADVTLLERGDRLAFGCSEGNAGLISPSHAQPLASPAALRQGLRWLARPDAPFSLRPRPAALPWLARFVAAARAERAGTGERLLRELALASLRLHAELAEQGLPTGFERRGTLTLYESAAGFAAGRREAEHVALESRVLTPDEVRELEPAVRGETVGGVYYPDEAQCEPRGYVEAVGHAAADAGAKLRLDVEVRRLRRANGRVLLETAGGDLRPETVVLAAGAWTGRLARSVGVFVPLEGGKGYHVDLVPSAGDPRLPVFLHESRTAATPLSGRLRLSGTLELAGLDTTIARRRVDAIRRAGARAFGSHEGRTVLDVWAGLRPCTPDGLPVVGRPAAVDGLVLATGHAMKGLALAPITARLVAELVAGEQPSLDVAPLRPDRFRPLLQPRRSSPGANSAPSSGP